MRFIRTAGIYIWHAVICISVLAVIFALFWSALYVVSVHRRRQAERLFQSFAALSPTHLDHSYLQRFVKDSGGRVNCVGDSCVYNYKEDFGFGSEWLFQFSRRTEWDYVGVRPWQFTIELKTTNGEVTNSTLHFFVGRGRGWLYSETPLSGNMWAWLGVSVTNSFKGFAEAVNFEKDRLRLQGWAGGPGLVIQKPNLNTDGGGEMLAALLSPDAPSESKNIAFDLNIRCATAMSPCTELCQLYPSAWQSYGQFQKSQGWYVEEPGICPPLNRSSTNVR